MIHHPFARATHPGYKPLYFVLCTRNEDTIERLHVKPIAKKTHMKEIESSIVAEETIVVERVRERSIGSRALHFA